MSNVTQFPGTTKTAIKNFVEAVKNMVEEMPAQLEYQRLRAKIHREYYTALINEGFDKADALFLTSKMQ